MKFSVCELLKNLHLSINKITTSRSIVTCVVGDLVGKGWSMIHFGGHKFSTHVANDAVYMIRKVHLDWFFFFCLTSVSLLFHFKAFFFVTSQEKSTQSDQICRDIRRVFFKGEACATVDSWVSLLVFEFIFKRTLLMWSLISGCVMETIDIWLMGNDLFPHTSHLSLRICKSCLICPKQSQEETTVLMPLKSGH